MKMAGSIVLASIVSAAMAAPAVAGFQNHVVPGNYENTPGTSLFLGPMTVGPRTYQMLIHESLLTDLVGRQLTGMSFRLPIGASDPWPAANVSYADYDVYLSGSVAPADRSLTFAENVVGPQTQVRSGSLDVSMGGYSAGGSPVNAFGPAIGFHSNWTYTGGHLLVEIRHTGNNFGSRAVDAISATSPGYGTLFSAAWQSSYTATTGSQGNFTIVQFSSIPAPGALALLGLAGLCGVRRRRN